MVEYDEGMTEEDKKARFTQWLDDYYSGDPERRKRVLDRFCDRMDAIDPLKLDLSCLNGRRNTGDGSGRLTASEKDLLKLLDRFRNDQSLTVKTEVENPDYFNQRYNTPQAKERVRIQRKIMTEGYDNYIFRGLLANNDLYQDFLSSKEMGQKPGEIRKTIERNAGMYIWGGLEAQKIEIAAFEGLPYQRILNTSLQHENAEELYANPIVRDENGAYSIQTKGMLNRVYGDVVGYSLEYNQKTVRKELGIRESDMVFIDGRSAYELYGEKYSRLPLEEQEKQIRCEVAAAAIEGRHRIEVGTLHIGSDGEYKVMLSPVEFNMHAMDVREKRSNYSALRRLFDFGPFKIKTTADRQDELNRNDPGREERHAQIKERLGSVMRLRREEATLAGAERDKAGASKRDKVDLKELSREAAKAGEMPSARQRSRSMSSQQTQRQTRERSNSEPAAVKPAPQKQDGPSR